MKAFSPSAAQLAAIESEKELVLVIAGPGSGKTATLIRRIQRLVEGGCNPRLIVAITFTNAAAAEITKRLKCSACGGSGYCETGVEGPHGQREMMPCDCHGQDFRLGYVGTLHGYLLRLLKEHGSVIGLPRKLSVIDEAAGKAILAQIIAEMNYSGSVKAAEEACGLNLLFRPPTRPLDKPERLAVAYHTKLIENGILNFDSILTYGFEVVSRLRESGKLLAAHLFVDEFQDSSDLDAAIYRTLPAANKFFVGDLDQSIYSFRGGNCENILALSRHPDCEVVIMEENFRCGSVICDAANAVIAHNEKRVAKRTISATGSAGSAALLPANDEQQEFYTMAQMCGEALRGGSNGVAVLCPTNALVEKASLALMAAGVPVKARKRTEKPKDWSRCRAALALLANPFNDVLARLWIEQEQGADEARRAVASQWAGDFKPLNEIASCLRLPTDTELARVPDALAGLGVGMESVEMVRDAIAKMTDGSVSDLTLALAAGDFGGEEIGDGVVVTTLHSAKGREWDSVWLLACNEGILPRKDDERLEEARRLFFVGVTRARERLVISSAANRLPPFKRQPVPFAVSRFIEESNIK